MKWIEDFTRYVTVTVPRMPGELHFVDRVASELFIARTTVKPKILHSNEGYFLPPTSSIWARNSENYHSGCDPEGYGFVADAGEEIWSRDQETSLKDDVI